jgi:hypothetical protein
MAVTLVRRRLCAGIALLALCCAPTGLAVADETKANLAYARGDKAFAEKRYAEAASAFAEADAESPHPIALTSALKAAILADDAVLSMELADRAAQRPNAPELEQQVQRAKQTFQTRVGRLSVVCDGCAPQLGQRALTPGKRVWVKTGTHTLTVGARSFEVAVTASDPTDFVVPPLPAAPQVAEPQPPPLVPPPPVQPPPGPGAKDEGSGVHPALFGSLVGLTAVNAVLLTVFGVRALNRNSEYLAGDDSALDSGQFSQTLANVFIATTALSAAGAALALPFTNFGGSSVQASVGPLSASLSVALP